MDPDEIDEAIKAGRRNASVDQQRIQAAHDTLGELGAVCSSFAAPVLATIKAAGDWEIDILAAPFTGPHDRDTDGEYFTDATQFHDDKYPLPPLVYYHGYDEQKRAMSKPEYIGRTVKRWVDQAGVWYRGVLNQASPLAEKVMQAARSGAAVASSGSIAHLVRRSSGHLAEWPIVELSVWDGDGSRRQANRYAVARAVTKMMYAEAGLAAPPNLDPPQVVPEGTSVQSGGTSADAGGSRTYEVKRAMDPEEIKKLAAEAAEAAVKAERERVAAEAQSAQALQAKIDEAVKAKQDEWEANAAKSRRLPDGNGQAPHVARFAAMRKYDNLEPEDVAVLIGILDGYDDQGRQYRRASQDAYKALAIKAAESTTTFGNATKAMMQQAGVAMKADEIQQQDLTGFGDEWVGVAYSNAIWDRVRADTWVAERIPSIEFPEGVESMIIPLEGTDPVFYKVAEATDTNAATGWPAATIPSSQVGTGKQQLNLVKMGARVLWSGELNEDSLVPWVPQLRTQMSRAGAEQLEHAIIDGDTATAATTNINDIGNAGVQTATNLYLLFDGFRKVALVTNSANSRAGGTLAADDFLETADLMGDAGVLGADTGRVSFILGGAMRKKVLQLAEVKTRDVNSSPTIENGRLTSIYGYRVDMSYFMHFKSATRLANTTGRVDQTTPANNTTGSLLAVAWDHWRLGFRRRMTIETTRIARADTTEIVAMMRVALGRRDNEGAAISYGLT